MFDALCRQWDLSAFAIRDLRELEGMEEFIGLVEGLLKANWGMNWVEFWECVVWNVDNRGMGEVERMDREEEMEIVRRVLEKWKQRKEAEILERRDVRITEMLKKLI